MSHISPSQGTMARPVLYQECRLHLQEGAWRKSTLVILNSECNSVALGWLVRAFFLRTRAELDRHSRWAGVEAAHFRLQLPQL